MQSCPQLKMVGLIILLLHDGEKAIHIHRNYTSNFVLSLPSNMQYILSY